MQIVNRRESLFPAGDHAAPAANIKDPQPMLTSDLHSNTGEIIPFVGLGDKGSPERRSLWLCGTELGDAEHPSGDGYDPETHDVARQWSWSRYNQNAFKLIQAIETGVIEDTRAFAEKRRIFHAADCDYFQTNLFPEACSTLASWTEEQQDRSGFPSKADYQESYRNTAFEKLRQQIVDHRPRLFIGVGVTHAADFDRVVPSDGSSLQEYRFDIKGFAKRILVRPGVIPLAIVPYATKHGLNSDESILEAANIIVKALDAS